LFFRFIVRLLNIIDFIFVFISVLSLRLTIFFFLFILHWFQIFWYYFLWRPFLVFLLFNLLLCFVFLIPFLFSSSSHLNFLAFMKFFYYVLTFIELYGFFPAVFIFLHQNTWLWQLTFHIVFILVYIFILTILFLKVIISWCFYFLKFNWRLFKFINWLAFIIIRFFLDYFSHFFN